MYTQTCNITKNIVTKLDYYDMMFKLESKATLISYFKVSVAVLPYEEASKLCNGVLPDYIPKGRTPRILKLRNNPGCPCSGTHVSDISEIISMKVSQIRTKKGMTKVFYTVGS